MVVPGRSAAAREAKPTTTMKKPTAKPEKEKEKERTRDKETIKKQSSSHTEPESPSYRLALKSLFSCRNSHSHANHHHHHHHAPDSKKCKKLGCSASICNLKDNPRVMQRPEDPAPVEQCKRRASVSACNSSSERCVKKPLSEVNATSAPKQAPGASLLSTSSSSSTGGSFRGMQLRRLSGCYECHMVVDPISGMFREGSMRASICSCPECGEIFVRAESLELHQSIRHAVSELGPEDTSRNIIEIIFQSSWLKKHTPVCKIDRILKVHNTQKTLARFEEYRDSVKAKASKLSKKHPRCTADGNELLRFHCATLACSLGLHGATHLCDAAPAGCPACGVIRDGFKTAGGDGGIRTMATSGRAHDAVEGGEERRAMLVCRVIAGRVKRGQDSGSDEYDSVAGSAGVYSNLDELVVFNPKAILPCFVVVYKA